MSLSTSFSPGFEYCYFEIPAGYPNRICDYAENVCVLIAYGYYVFPYVCIVVGASVVSLCGVPGGGEPALS